LKTKLLHTVFHGPYHVLSFLNFKFKVKNKKMANLYIYQIDFIFIDSGVETG